MLRRIVALLRYVQSYGSRSGSGWVRDGNVDVRNNIKVD